MKSLLSSMQFFNCIKKLKGSWSISTFLVIPILFFSAQIFGQSADLDQIRNGSAGSPENPANWVNGNAGPSNAHFAEGYSVPYRMKIASLVGNANTIHTLVIEWDTKDQNGHAIDYITHYNNIDNELGSHQATFHHNPEALNPALGTAFAGTSPTLFPIPPPTIFANSEVVGMPRASFNNLPGQTGNADITKMAIWGGTITEITYGPETAPDANTPSTKTTCTIKFKSTNGSTALIAWGGHIGAEYDWGGGRGATGVNGSPYHTRLVSIDGGGGSQDRSLKASAVVVPPPTCGISSAQYVCNGTTSLSFSATGSSTGSNVSYVWTLTNGSTSAGAKIDGSNTGYTISVVPIGAAFIGGGTFNLSLTVNKTGATSATCTRTPAGTIQKVVTTASASPTLVDITSAAHSTTLTANIGATSTDLNNANYDYLWTIVTGGTTGVLSNATSRIATYTAGVGDAGSSIQFRVTATQKAIPQCADDEVVSISLNSPGACNVSSQAAVCQGTTTTHNGSPSPKPGTATYTWSLQGHGGAGTTTSTFASANGGISIQLNATQSYRIVLSQVYENTAFNTSCFQDVTVVPTLSLQTQYNAPSCSQKTFTVDVVNPISGVVYSIDQPGNNIIFPTKTSTAGSAVQFTGLTNGDGYTVTMTSTTADCSVTSSCATNPSSARPAPTTSTETIVTPEASKMETKSPEVYDIVLRSPTKVTALPNPFTDKIKFNLVSGVSGYGTLELYNSLGQKIAVVYEGHIQAGRELSKEYITSERRETLLYVFKVGDQRISGKLIGLKSKF
ncbi:MAG: hypothetical protein V4556_01320 [Bacteroidota bacterium]